MDDLRVTDANNTPISTVHVPFFWWGLFIIYVILIGLVVVSYISLNTQIKNIKKQYLSNAIKKIIYIRNSGLFTPMTKS